MTKFTVNRVISHLASVVMVIGAGLLSPAVHADTASFTTTVNGVPGSAAGNADGSGVLVRPGETVGLLLSTPFGLFADDGFTPLNNNVGIFALSDIGSTVASLSFGRYNGGDPVLFHTQNFNTQAAGSSVDFGFLAFVGCGAAGGCDYVEVSGISASNGSSGFILDAITFSDVALSNVTASTPEPATWFFMITGFFLIALRSKQVRRNRPAKPSKHWSPASSMPVSETSMAA